MQFLHQVWKRLFRLIKYFFIYLVFSVIFIGIFAYIYRINDIPSPCFVSLIIFLGVEDFKSLPSSATRIYVAQIVLQNICFLAWISSFLSKFLKPLNPFFFPQYVVCHNNQIKFKYWIMLPDHLFLYNIYIRVYFSAGPLYNGGENKLTAEWELNDVSRQNIDLARGVHSLILSEEDTQILLTEIQKAQNCKEAKLVIMIHGSNSDGLTFWGRHSYNVKSHLKVGYEYVPIRQPECIRIVKSISENLQIREKRYSIRYQNFDKIYSPRNIKSYFGKGSLKYKPHDELNNKNVFSYHQIAYGQYGHGIRSSFLFFFNLLVALFLDKNAHNDFKKEQ